MTAIITPLPQLLAKSHRRETDKVAEKTWRGRYTNLAYLTSSESTDIADAFLSRGLKERIGHR